MSDEIALREGALTPTEVETVTFRVTRLRQGYDAKEVDDFLDRVQAEVALLAAENEKLRGALSRRVGSNTRPGGETGSFDSPVGVSAIGGAGSITGSADLLARRADIERDVNALEAFEREYRTRLRAWIGGMLDELDHPEDVPLNPPTPAPARALRQSQEQPLVQGAAYHDDIEDTSEIPVVDERWQDRDWPKQKKKKKKERKSKPNSKQRSRDFTLPANDPHGPDPVTQPA